MLLLKSKIAKVMNLCLSICKAMLNYIEIWILENFSWFTTRIMEKLMIAVETIVFEFVCVYVWVCIFQYQNQIPPSSKKEKQISFFFSRTSPHTHTLPHLAIDRNIRGLLYFFFFFSWFQPSILINISKTVKITNQGL